MSNESENLSYSLYEENIDKNITHHDLINLVNFMETNNQMDDFVALEINYQTNFTRKHLDRIAEYYGIYLKSHRAGRRRRKKKNELIQDIILFEKNPENIDIVFKRKRLWQYMQEIKKDSFLSKFLIFN